MFRIDKQFLSNSINLVDSLEQLVLILRCSAPFVPIDLISTNITVLCT